MSILGDFFIRYLFVLVLFYSLISGADTRRSFARAETYFKGGRYKRSISILKSIYSSRNISITDKVKAAVMISKSYRKEEKPEKAFEILKEVSMGREGEYWLEYSEVCLEVKDLEGALRGTNWFSSQSRKDYVLKSDWVRARAESANEDYYRSMLSCKALLKDVPAYYSGRSDFDRDAI
ncbi:MAG: hypothetical protein U9O87_00020, partial [Verrucomicrobiota bacterium]|nr:hypothetical protein [Verrucomicrobiota bacterium]